MTIPEQHMMHLKTVSMTGPERAAVRARIAAFAVANPAVTGLTARAWGWTVRHSAFAFGLALLAVVGGTGVSASRAHPGDALYGFRLSVNDRVETALAFSADARIDSEMGQLQRLLDDEDVFRDDELGMFAYADTDESDDIDDDLERELRDIERELAEESQALELGDTGTSRTPEPFDDGVLEQELRNLEHELRFESDAELELEIE